MHFDDRADDYAAARPPYPPALWQRLRTLGLLRPGATALDLGAGTGQATEPLLEAGLRVTAVEPGRRLAAKLRSAHPTARLLVERAEDAEFSDAEFDLVVAATSIHWMDLDVVVPKIHACLKEDGRFLVWRHVFGDPRGRPTPFRDRVAEIVRARSATADARGSAEDLAATADRLTASGLFDVEESATFLWDIELNAEQVERLFGTFSDWSAREARQAASAADGLGGVVLEHYSSWLLVLAPGDRRQGRPDVERWISRSSPPRRERAGCRGSRRASRLGGARTLSSAERPRALYLSAAAGSGRCTPRGRYPSA